MKKTRKKGNLALRRRIRKTTASLFMILAIVVAMLPVENMKTVSATRITADARTTISADYSANYNAGTKADLYDENYYEKDSATGYTGDEVPVQRIENNTITTLFKAKKKNNSQTNTEAMITSYVNPSIDESVEIKEIESYQYVQMDKTYLSKLDDAFGGETYIATFDTIPYSSAIYPANSGLTEYTLKQLKTTATYTASSYEASSSTNFINYTAPTDVYNDFVNLKSTTASTYVQALYNSSVFKTYLTDAQNAIGNYNEKLSTYKAELDAIYNATTKDVNAWNAKIAEIDAELAKYQTLKKSYIDFASKKYDNLKYIQEYTICNRLTNNNTQDLSFYELIECVPSGGGDAVFIPCTSSGIYLSKGTVDITGIAHEAFARNSNNTSNTILSITIPNSVAFVGADAFYGQSRLTSVTLNDSKCKVIGDRAFSGCSSINSFTFGSASSGASAIDLIGNHAFENTGSLGTSDTAFQVPETVTQIGIGCFNESDIVNLSFKENTGSSLTIDEYAFKDCKNLEKVSFPTKKKFVIKKGAFACSNGSDGLNDFSYPTSITELYTGSDEDTYDFVLAGREGLRNVVLPDSLGKGTNNKKIPDNTFAGCIGLSTVTFPDNAGYATFGINLFSDVTNEEFIIIGPEYIAGTTNHAQPRKDAWDAVFLPNGSSGTVPYQYTNTKGTHLEIGEGDYIKSIDVKDTTYAILSNYDTKPGVTSSTPISLTIPPKVGHYIIDEIASGFLGSGVKDKIYKVVISDGTVKKINNSAFEGCENLQWVEIGDSVTNIGNRAFADCKKLENVVFSQTKTSTWGPDDSYWTNLQILDDAFDTDSELLTFHGAINPDYAPYVIASNKGATKQPLTSTGNEICYVTDAPLNLTVIKDNSTGDNNGKMTLIDYPHYEDIDADNSKLIKNKEDSLSLGGSGGTDSYSIIDRFELFNNIVSSINSYDGGDDLDSKEKSIVDQTLNMDLPEGIESIDSKAFFTATKENAGSIKYFNRTYNDTGTEIKTLSRKYSNGGNAYERLLNHTIASKYHAIENVYSTITEGTGSTPEEVIPGLFSGYFYGNQDPSLVKVIDPATGTHKVYNGHTYVEEVSRGNDHLTSINLESVTTLPDYAFDSNENLLSVSFSDKMTQIGALPFRGCKALTTVNTNGNTKYIFDNGILYEVLDNGSYKIIECLESRANGINKTNDPNLTKVSELADGCFSNCEELTDVDLTAAKFTTLPADAFNGCDKLTTVSLPNTVQTIKDTAFSNIEGTGSVTISIPNLNCTLNKGMCDGSAKKFVIKGVKYRDEINGVYSSCYDSFEDLQKAYGKDSKGNYKAEWGDYAQTFTVTFKLLDNTVIGESQEVSKGKDATPPTAPDINGKKFVNWYCEINGVLYNDSSAYTNITEDRTIFAVYNDDKTVVVSDGNKYTLTMSTGQASLASDLTTYSSSLQAVGGTSIAIIYNSTTVDFTTWSAKGTSSGTDYSSLINPITATTALFTMPNDNVTIGINTVTSSGSGSGSSGSGSSGSGSNSGSGSSDTTTKYSLTVNYGSGSGEYAAGEIVSISANAPDSSTRVFSKWTSSTSGVGFADATKVSTTITMPASAVVVTANYKTRTSDDEDDDSSSSSSNRRPQSNTTSTTVTTGTGTTTSTNTNTGATNNATNNTQTTGNGDELYITKNGVSNKDVGNANVEGSTDNFVVKISDSEDAAELAKQALLNKYGSLDGIAYFPMDISLFDASGNNQITDTYGLNVTVTMPIPDTLIQYGGNAHVAAVEGGYLQDLTPKFTTIDGIGCISFIPPHFSPYVIYVDTNNLVAGQTLDSTPQTGDPIHPKWFLATGMACLSVFLFVSGDRKKKIRLA